MSTMSNVSQLNDLRSYSRHWLGEFIDMYQAEECLWQNKHPDYSNHNVRNKAYDKLVEKIKEVEPNPDRAMVVRKINSLRSAFRREYRKSSAKAGYETRLWYYDKMLFISDKNHKMQSSTGSGGGTVDGKPLKRSLALSFDDDDSMEFETEEEQQIETVVSDSGSHQQADVSTVTVTTGDCVTLVKSEEHHLHHRQQEQQHHPHPTHLQSSAHTHSQPQHATEVKVLEITSLDSNSQREIQQAVSSLEQQHQMQQLQHQQQHHQSGHGPATAQLAQIQIAREHLQPLFGNTYSTATTTHRQEDEYDAIGMNVASKLRVMNPTQRIIAEKLISDVLFNGQLDNLSVNSALTQ